VARVVRAEIPEEMVLVAGSTSAGWLRHFQPLLFVAIAAFTFQVYIIRVRCIRGLTTAEVQDSDVAADLDLLASNDDDDDTSLLLIRGCESDNEIE